MSTTENRGIHADNLSRCVEQGAARVAWIDGCISLDIILSVNGKAVQNSNQVQQALETGQVGTTVKVEVRRKNQNITLDVTPIAAPPIADERE